MNFKKYLFAALIPLTYMQVYADTNYDATTAVTDAQLNAILKSLLKIAPSSTTATGVKFEGFFSLNDQRYLTGLDLKSVQFKVTTKILGIPLSSNVTISLAGVVPTLDCNNPQVTRVNVSGSNSLLDNAIRDHVNKNSLSIFRDNFIAQTNLAKYCKIKPKPSKSKLPPLAFVFTLEKDM